MQKMGSNHHHDHLRFMQPLLPDFLKSFMMPVSFLKKLEGELQGHKLETVVLMTEDEPQRHWVIGVESHRLFKDNWKHFCVHHNLQVGDFLVFTYQSHFLFHVAVFDSVTACQRTTSPSFDHLKLMPIPKEPKEMKSDRAPAMPSKQDHSSCDVKLSPYNVKHAIISLPADFARKNGLRYRKCELTIIDGKRRAWPAILNYKQGCGQSYIKRGWKDFLTANAFKPGNSLRFQLLKGGTSPTLKCYRPRRIAVEPNSGCGTPPKQAEARSGATIKSKKNLTRYLSCHITLSAYAVKTPIIFFPVHFVRGSGLRDGSCVVKVIDEKDRTWQVNLNVKKCDARAYINGGWRAVQTANGYVVGDVICFELLDAGEHPTLRCYRPRRIAVEPNSGCGTPSKQAEADSGTRTIKSKKNLTRYLSCHITLTDYAVKTPIIYLPVHFMRGSGLKYRRCVVRVVDEKDRKWQVNLCFKDCNTKAYISGGWRAVQAANSYMVGDVICFELLNAGEHPTLRCYRTYSKRKPWLFHKA